MVFPSAPHFSPTTAALIIEMQFDKNWSTLHTCEETVPNREYERMGLGMDAVLSPKAFDTELARMVLQRLGQG
jgi:hypothetical protein